VTEVHPLPVEAKAVNWKSTTVKVNKITEKRALFEFSIVIEAFSPLLTIKWFSEQFNPCFKFRNIQSYTTIRNISVLEERETTKRKSFSG
jgi:hypothetical protein